MKATRFWRLRFARIAPAYYLALLLALPIIAQVVAESKASGWSIAVGLASVLLFLQSWWPAYVTLWNFPAWSLSVECLFYALFPWLARALARWPVAVVFAGSYALIVLTSTQRVEFMAFARGYAPDHWLMPTIFPLLHLPLFVFGMALARLYLFSQARSSRLHAAMLGSGVILLVLIFGGTGASMLPSWLLSDAVLVPAFALVIFGGAGAAGTIPLFTRPAFILLGEASYSIYILHIPLRPWWDDFVDAIPGLSLTPWLHFLLYFGFVVLVSVVVFRRVETPMRQWIAGRDVERARPANVTPILQTSGAS